MSRHEVFLVVDVPVRITLHTAKVKLLHNGRKVVLPKSRGVLQAKCTLQLRDHVLIWIVFSMWNDINVFTCGQGMQKSCGNVSG